MKNQFGKTSVLQMTAKYNGEKTILEDVFFTAPYKVIKPFYEEDGFMKVMQVMASAGIMEGDAGKIQIEAKERAKVEFISQSYEKIHRMKDGNAMRDIELKVYKNAFLKYCPLPTIPFADSAFDSTMQVELADDTSKLILCEILSSGRSAFGERFQYRYYHSLVEVRKAGKLIYRDNNRFKRGMASLERIGMFEGYTHLANLLLCNIEKKEEWILKARDLIDLNENVEGGVSRLQSNDIIIRILGNNSQMLQNICDELLKER